MSTMRNGVGFAVGTFTIVPVKGAIDVNPRSARLGILLSPVIGMLLGLCGALVLWLVSRFHESQTTSIVGAALAIGMITWLTRAFHLDGLADTADALGSRRTGADALAIAKRSDIGPFGVISLIFVVLLDVLALAGLPSLQAALAAIIIATTVGRVALVVVCTPSYRPARQDGLGKAVAGCVPTVAGVAWVAIAVAGAMAFVWGITGDTRPTLVAGIAVVLGVAAAKVLALRASARFGGVTGDVYGAAIEVATVVCLVVTAVAWS